MMRIPMLEDVQRNMREYSLNKNWPDIAEIADEMGEDFFDFYSDREWHVRDSVNSPVMRDWHGRARMWVRRFRERNPMVLKAKETPNYKEKILEVYKQMRGK